MTSNSTDFVGGLFFIVFGLAGIFFGDKLHDSYMKRMSRLRFKEILGGRVILMTPFWKKKDEDRWLKVTDVPQLAPPKEVSIKVYRAMGVIFLIFGITLFLTNFLFR